MRKQTAQTLDSFYQAAFSRLGPSHWWPGDGALEIIVGAVLTQNTAWTNVEKALNNLKTVSLLDGPALLALPEAQLAELIRPAGFFNLKARRLRNVLEFFNERCAFAFDQLTGPNLDCSMDSLREDLLAVKGVGRETADSILLYALEQPSFVVDAYTWRMLSRHALAGEDTEYEDMRSMFMSCLPEDVQLYNEYHALIVRLGKDWCRKSKPRCSDCPLGAFLEGGALAD